MKIVILSLLLLSIVVAIRPPSPYCRSSPIPNIIPIAVNSTLRVDLEQVFDGYNMDITGPARDTINVIPKYVVNKNTFDQQFNFSTAKIKQNNRFLGLIINQFTSKLVIGTNNQTTGVKVDLIVQIEDIPNLHCYDVDQIVTRNQTYAVIDCGEFRNGELIVNHFLYVDLSSGQKVLGGKTHDAFVQYNHISKRNIQVIEDPFNRILYILRIYTRDGVDQMHKNNTYIEVFLIRDAVDPQIIDVLDYTLLDIKQLSIADYQVIFGRIYILAYNRGIYEIQITRDQRLQMKSFFQIKMDMHKFKVDRIGFNDDLYIAITNGNQIYTYEWDIISPPKIIQKYGLMANSHVEQIVCNTEFIMILASNQIDGKFQRNHWIFSRRSTSYTHAFNIFQAPDHGPAIMQWQGNDRTFHLFHSTNSYNIKISLPYLQIKQVSQGKAGQKQQYTVSAVSMGDTENKTCIQKFTFIYQFHNDTTIYKTGFYDKMNVTVDSPDEQIIDLGRQFYGRNLTYNITYETGNSSLLPHTYVDKIHKAVFNQIKQIKPQNVVWFEMFQQINAQQPTPNSIYGFVQTIVEQTKNLTNKTYDSHYIKCEINVVDRDQTHQFKCRIVTSTRFGMGKIIISSQMFDPKERRMALVFDNAPNTVYIYYFWQAGFGFYGRRDYAGDAWNILSSVTVSKGKLFVTLQNSKRVEVYNLIDLREQGDAPNIVKPIFVLNSQVMRFFGVDYWAPVKTKVSPFHDQVVFVKTKTGVMAINVNEDGMPQLLFHIQTLNVQYDFEVSHASLVVIDQERSELYHLYTPLRRSKQPYLRQVINFKFNMIDYDQITADRLFYLVGFNELVVVNPYFTNTNAVYAQLKFSDIIMFIDAVNIKGRQVLFVHTTKEILAYVIRQSPMLYVEWPSHQKNFNLTLGAYNNYSKSQNYNFLFNVLDLNQTQITPRQQFNEQQIKKIGHVKVRENQKKKFTFNVTFNDSQWFNGNVFHYTINCTHCGKNQSIHVKNHVEQVQQLVAGRAIYDMESSWNGIYAQQYDSFIKTWAHNDSIQYIQNIPTTMRGQVCSKIVVANSHDYVISLCQTGNEVNVYITTLISDKPFTSGPFPTQAKAVNSAKIIDDILMIVDNEDDPFVRSGGIYLYSLTFNDQIQMSMIDYIDNQDLYIQGFTGRTNIGSADFHDSHGIQEYRILISDANSGSIFILSFQLSPNRQEIVYLSKKRLDLKNYIPAEVQAPTRIKLITLTIHYYVTYQQDSLVDYYLLITSANWHHMELKVTVDRTDMVRDVKLIRMFERVPGWTLKNYFRMRRDWQKSQFAIPYVNYELNRQIVAVYQADWIIFMDEEEKDRQTKLNVPTVYQQVQRSLTFETENIINNKKQEIKDQLVHIPLVPMLGVHRVLDTFEVAYAFNARESHNLLFTDMDGYNITQLQINPNVTLYVNDLSQPDTVNITAHNPYNNFTFAIQLKYIDEDQQQRQEYIWIVIVVIGIMMIIGLFVVYCKGKRQAGIIAKNSKRTTAPIADNQASLITVEDKYRDDYINRTSVDPESIRGTIDLGLGESLLIKEENREESGNNLGQTPATTSPNPII